MSDENEADRRDLPTPNAGRTPARPASGAQVDTFLAQARRLAPVTAADPRPRLVFALDATASRQPTWDLACGVQGEMSPLRPRSVGCASSWSTSAASTSAAHPVGWRSRAP